MRALPCCLALCLLSLPGVRAADAVATGMNRFAVELHRQLAASSGNLVFSPFSNATALSMLLDAARGETAVELARVLHQPYPDSSHDASVTGLADQLIRHGNAEGSELHIANGLWIQRGYPVRAEFERALVQYYHASVTQFDFASNPEQARTGINFWTASQTKGKIQELFAAGQLARETRMVLSSAIYFHGLWQADFHYDDTHPAVFRAPGETMHVDTMNQTAAFAYADGPTCQVLEMKYGQSPLVFDVLLPKVTGSLGALEAGLTAEKLASLWTSLSSRKVAVSLPRFHVDADVSLRDALGHLGAPALFANADFSGVGGRRDLALADVRHKAFVEVNEQGTVAAALSGSSTTLISTSGAPAVFRADHPFLFVIRDPHTGVILFFGRVVKPRQ